EAAPNSFKFFLSLFLSLCPSLTRRSLRECVLCGSLRQAAPRLRFFLVVKYGLAHLHTELV
ncbi:MAG: hypothetical protein RMY62_002450, partial [Nostoc sp. ZfuVER08]|nr:hypothetical protein [Nostoc sp. ZfuVER08]